ncbi:hypothetical protein LIH_03380 [Leptospira interrogans serovar Hardjo-prajitno]|uniref:Uncharacterized protein n=2 Tax=Leptospira interrogans TaxID=173 RepID=A0A0F6HF29_LEPIR|nr:hypothetical protein G436_0654 [Leptospira interrogans serovar Hardjo str. Norma]ALN99396.1 hypothetical protein LIH_03380 [Leptospira interrogans serovar Hardjo-prajitno]EKO26969.1 hypothetical protein LEP1GSC104_1061 [Leptospira interrogans str. UI 12621]EMJ48514.1 hypothetical protein LEP1GSC111_1657 [Leptospira interrogans str. UT126]
MWELTKLRFTQLNFENCGNYYKIQKELSFNQIFAQNRCFAAIIKISIPVQLSKTFLKV